jgi:hypothetical protein
VGAGGSRQASHPSFVDRFQHAQYMAQAYSSIGRVDDSRGFRQGKCRPSLRFQINTVHLISATHFQRQGKAVKEKHSDERDERDLRRVTRQICYGERADTEGMLLSARLLSPSKITSCGGSTVLGVTTARQLRDGVDCRTVPNYRYATLHEGEVNSSGTNLPGESYLDSLTRLTASEDQDSILCCVKGLKQKPR